MEDIIMKRLASAIAALLIAASAFTAAQAAAPTMSPDAQTYVTVTSKDGLNSAAVENTGKDSAAAALRGVIYAPDSLAISGASASQTFEVRTVSKNDAPTDVFLRLSNDTTSKTAEYDATKLITTYIIEIKNQEGDTVYNSALVKPEIKKTGASEYSLDVYLGRFNGDDGKSKETYTLNVKLPKGLAASDIKNLKKVNWSVVSDPAEPGSTPLPTPEIKVTAAPTAAVSASEATRSPSTTSPTTAATTAATTAPTAAATDAPLSMASDSAKTVGTGKGEIPPGKYTIKATNNEAVVKIYGSDGKLKSEYELTEKVPSVVVELLSGEKLENVGAIDLKEYRTATATPKATAKATTRPTTTTKTATTAPKATTAPSKTNPKTGDTAPIAGVCALGVFALGMLAYPAIEKKRNNK